MPTASTVLPNWFTRLQGLAVLAIGVTGGAALAGVFGLMIVQAVVYRDFSNYTLAGNPWEHSSFPWYVIDSMRLLSIFGGIAIGSVCFVVLFGGIVLATNRLARPEGTYEAMRRLCAAFVAILVMLGGAAWFGHWFG